MSDMTDAEQYKKLLIPWFQKNGRNLPWRRTQDSYAILVSEMMLQQTQVATVIDYFHRWMQRFPNWQSLAEAEEQTVLAMWQGLGYYARARNLHRAAKIVSECYGGVLPEDLEVIRSLPGVGRYTAGAVASFAFDLPEPIVDANIARVLARLFDFREPVDSSRGNKAIWEFAASLVPQTQAGVFNEALMELGATLCLPKQPRCSECPLRPLCLALKTGEPEKLPIKKDRRKTVYLTEDRALIIQDGKVLLQQETGRRWRGLWRLPDTVNPEGEPVNVVRYPITHHQITMCVWKTSVPLATEKDQQWFDLKDIHNIPMPAPHRRALPID